MIAGPAEPGNAKGTMQIFELVKRRRNAGYDYEVIAETGRVVTHREETRTYVAAAIQSHPTIVGAYSFLQWTGDVRSLNEQTGDGIIYAIDRNVKTKDVPEWLRDQFKEWRASLEKQTEGDRVTYDRRRRTLLRSRRRPTLRRLANPGVGRRRLSYRTETRGRTIDDNAGSGVVGRRD
jgi:hypothetical protein